MKILLSWMQEFAPIEAPPTEIADALTDLGLVVESVDSVLPDWSGIVVARVLSLRPHPKADRIQLVDVDADGSGEPLQICCGAFNMAEGDLVPLATIGTVMPGGMEIAQRKMRGEWSNGMLCSAAELDWVGLDVDAADGIHILDPGAAVGMPLVEALGLTQDWLFDIDVEGNRPDALSVAGVARDLAPRFGVAFTFPDLPVDEAGEPAGQRASVRIDDADLCLRFGARVLDNVTIGTSPTWMQARLIAAGMRPINSIVDISNYVMLELGQPNHTYDLSLVDGATLGVRMAREGETLVTLDGQQRNLTPSDGVICDGQDQPIGLAGVMGGASTEIGEHSTSVLLEAAVWDRMTIAGTSRRLGLRSEASVRFERGVDPLGIERALDRFCGLAAELCGATVAPETIIVEGGYEPTPPVRVRVERVNRLLNTSLDGPAITQLLDPIGFRCEPLADDDALLVHIPSWRPDAAIEEDVVEEIARHHGYSRSGKRVPRPSQNGALTPIQQARRRLRRACIGARLSEAMPIPFLAPGDLMAAGLDPAEAIALENPLVAEESILRTSLLPGLLKAVAFNQSHRNTDVRLFELGRVFRPGPEGSELPEEDERVAAIVDDCSAIEATQLLWELAASLDVNLSLVNVGDAEPLPGLHPTRAAEVVLRGRTIGAVGEIDPRVAERFGVSGRVGWIDLSVASLAPVLEATPKYQQVSNYPSSDIDLAFVLDESVPADTVSRTLASAGRPLVRSVRFLNAYRSEQLGTDRRSLAFALRLQADDRTLTDAEVAECRQLMIDAVASKNGGALR